jgi:AcrR family transcriptional regulator
MADRRSLILDAAISVIASSGVRGLRVENVAAEAGVAVSLIYYYFGSRKGLVGATLNHANERAAITAPGGVRSTLLDELDESARRTSVVWGEVQASAVFQSELREQVRDATEAWVALVADAIAAEAPEHPDPRAAAERLTALVDGLAARWLAGALELARAHELLESAIVAEL